MADFRIQRLPDGTYLATSETIQGLVAQGRTATEAAEIARDVAQKLREARAEREAASFKELLEAAPLDGIDLTRRKDPPRDVAL
jgi:predicted RNase H-like HicB family nuclease